jgi:hypothetical protein
MLNANHEGSSLKEFYQTWGNSMGRRNKKIELQVMIPDDFSLEMDDEFEESQSELELMKRVKRIEAQFAPRKTKQISSKKKNQ